jgi:hypothetical protein
MEARLRGYRGKREGHDSTDTLSYDLLTTLFSVATPAI